MKWTDAPRMGGGVVRAAIRLGKIRARNRAIYTPEKMASEPSRQVKRAVARQQHKLAAREAKVAAKRLNRMNRRGRH